MIRAERQLELEVMECTTVLIVGILHCTRKPMGYVDTWCTIYQSDQEYCRRVESDANTNGTPMLPASVV